MKQNLFLMREISTENRKSFDRKQYVACNKVRLEWSELLVASITSK